MYEMSRALNGKYTHVIGKKYAELDLPKIYCYGDSLAKETLDFLNEHTLASQYFFCKTHFLLSECSDQFISFLTGYLKKLS